MKKANSVLELIGATPIMRLGRVADEGMAEVWGKLESANPGGSVKDRIALAMIETAEREGVLKPGGMVGLSEPGPHHSKTAQSQMEMRQFKVLENDIIIEDIEHKVGIVTSSWRRQKA